MLEIISKIVDTDDTSKFNKVFNAMGYTCATDRYVCVLAPLQEGERPDYTENIKRIYPESNIDVEVNVEEFNEDYEEEMACKTCHGRGEVTYTFEKYTRELDCPVCEGTGFALNDESVIINGVEFLKRYVVTLLYLANAVGVKSVKHVFTSPTKPNMFVVGELKVLIVPKVCLT